MAEDKKKDLPYPKVRGCMVTVSKKTWDQIHVGTIRAFDCTIVSSDKLSLDEIEVKLSSGEFPEIESGTGYPEAKIDKEGHVILKGQKYKARLAAPPMIPPIPAVPATA